MPDLIVEEMLVLIRQGVCPYCTDKLEPGPRGGLSQNFTCRRCGARFNKLGPGCELGAELIEGPKRQGRA